MTTSGRNFFRIGILFLLLFQFFFVGAQDTARVATQDTARVATRDTTRPQRRYFDSTLFADANTLTRADYLASLQKVFQTLNKVPIVTASFTQTDEITAQLDENDSALSLVRGRLSQSERTLNLRNLKMFWALLAKLRESNVEFSEQLKEYDATLDSLKKEVLELRKDTLIRTIFRDSTLRASFQPRLRELRGKWRKTDSLVRLSTELINNLKARVSDHSIAIQEMTYQADAQLKTVGVKAFGKERRYIWEPRTNPGRPSNVQSFQRSLQTEKKLTQFYFQYDRNERLILLFLGLLFFAWVTYNFRSLKRMGKSNELTDLKLRYISPNPIAASLVFLLNLAPVFDLYAPALYIETVQYIMMIVLTIFFRKRLSRKMFYSWLIFVLLFLLLAFTRNLGIPFSLQRWWTVGVNSASAIFGVYVMASFRNVMSRRKLFFLVTSLYICFHVLAILCNIYGRVTLSQLFGSAAIYEMMQAISLIVFVQIVTEACLLQVKASRIRKNYSAEFDIAKITNAVYRACSLIAIILWLVVLSINLNLYAAFREFLVQLLNTPRLIGSFSFTFGGVVLFMGIIWVAHVLQKYIAYFFGDTGDDIEFENKGRRSRLVVTRLILLVLGFLLAIAASGLPIDKITVILGALGVGIGLGLQSIVNNFVSGIILIFDRPLRIGDTVQIGDKKGRVKEISVRSSTLLTDEGAEVIIPNGDVLSQNIVNWSLSNNYVRLELTYHVEKPVSVDQIKAIVNEALESNEFVLRRREPEIFVNSINAMSLEVKVQFWCVDINRNDLTKSEVDAAIYEKLENNGFKPW